MSPMLNDVERLIIRWERLKMKAQKNDLVLKVDEALEPARIVIQNDGVRILTTSDLSEVEGFLKAAEEFASCRE